MQTIHEKPDDLHPVIETVQHTTLGKIIRKAKWLLALDQCMQTILPAEFAADCHVMNVNQFVLILGVSNAAVAMRIRLMTSELIEKLHQRAEFSAITLIQCKVCVTPLKYHISTA